MLIHCSEMVMALAALRYLQLSSAVVITGMSKGNLAARSHMRGVWGEGGGEGGVQPAYALDQSQLFRLGSTCLLQV